MEYEITSEDVLNTIKNNYRKTTKKISIYALLYIINAGSKSAVSLENLSSCLNELNENRSIIIEKYSSDGLVLRFKYIVLK